MTPQEKKVVGFLVVMALLGVLRLALQPRTVQTPGSEASSQGRP
ncbi:MAG TPA: hypothetical protein VHE12_00430 [bacterium]|nr:hypothetical protein [bacterium]